MRSGAALVLASLSAEGKSELSGYEHMLDGYEDFAEKLYELGADIKEIES